MVESSKSVLTGGSDGGESDRHCLTSVEMHSEQIPNTGSSVLFVCVVDFPLTTQEQPPSDALVADTNLIGYLRSVGVGDNGWFGYKTSHALVINLQS